MKAFNGYEPKYQAPGGNNFEPLPVGVYVGRIYGAKADDKSAWVLEKNRLNVSKGAVFTHVDDIASFVEYTSPYDTGVAVALSEGQLAVRNNTGKDLSNVYVYYKLVHTDGNFLGGITYRVPIGNLQADEEASSVAMHCNAANCKVVSITYTEEG